MADLRVERMTGLPQLKAGEEAGTVWVGLLVARERWNVSSLVGLIGLFGIAVQNGLVLIAQTKSLMGEGVSFDAALREASIGRARPKLMTA